MLETHFSHTFFTSGPKGDENFFINSAQRLLTSRVLHPVVVAILGELAVSFESLENENRAQSKAMIPCLGIRSKAVVVARRVTSRLTISKKIHGLGLLLSSIHSNRSSVSEMTNFPSIIFEQNKR